MISQDICAELLRLCAQEQSVFLELILILAALVLCELVFIFYLYRECI